MSNERDRPQTWPAQAKALLDQSVEQLDAATLSRLNRARQAALAQRRPRPRQWLLPTGLASACMLLLALLTWHAYVPRLAPSDTPVARTTSSGDLDLVSGEDSLEFYQDLEFYAWLEAQDQDLGS